ncbi:MAG: tetratricopeptide repeat protein, partial [Spirochaetaceae bacterium]|nr:tetratricopeptide repeat protein [Spirochaetaceae bacterium]
ESLAVRMVQDDERISELKADIRGVEKQVEKTIEAVRDKGTYWRLLGIKYMDYKMWDDALDAFDQAVEIYPENASLLYNRALSASQMALSVDTPELRSSYISRAEKGYVRAISVNPRFTPSLYALSVLLVFELDRPLEAAPLLEDYLKIERSNINGRFLLARVYLEAGRKSEALNLYDEIIEIARDKTDVLKAEELYNRVAGGGNEL